MEQYHFMSRTKGNDCYQACGRYYNPSPMRVHEFVLRTVIVSYSHDFSSTYSQLRSYFFFSLLLSTQLKSKARSILCSPAYPN